MNDNYLHNPYKIEQMIFSLGDDKWVMKITKTGIVFNREDYPNLTVDEFSSLVVKTLENNCHVKFYQETK